MGAKSTVREVRAAIYTRISNDPSQQAAGVGRQEKDCRQLCRENGWTVKEVYSDNDASAYSGKIRPEYERMLSDVAKGQIDVIVAYHADRLYRRVVDLESLITLVENAGCEIATCQSGNIDLSTSSGRTVARLLATVAMGESERAGERITRKHQQLAELGKPAGQKRSFGYDDNNEIIPSESAVIIEMAGRLLAGGDQANIRAMCRDMNERGIRTVRQREGEPPNWRPNTLSALLGSAKIAGLRERSRKSKTMRQKYRGKKMPRFGEITSKAVWKPIISEDDLYAIRAILMDEKRSTTRPSRYLLSGIAKCYACGETLNARNMKDKSGRRYSCLKRFNISEPCGKVSIVGTKLDAYILARVVEALDAQPPRGQDELSRKLSKQEQNAQAAIEQARHRKKEFAADYARSQIDREVYDAGIEAANEVIAKHEAQLWIKAPMSRDKRLRSGGSALTGQELLAKWPTMTLSDQKAVIQAVCEDIVIGPVKKRGYPVFDAGRISITLRQ